MRLSREDVAPLLAIVVAGSVSVLGTVAAAASLSRRPVEFEYDEIEPSVEFEVPAREPSFTTWTAVTDSRRDAAWVIAFQHARVVVDALLAQQRDVLARVRRFDDLWNQRVTLEREVTDLREVKEGMRQRLLDLQGELVRAAGESESPDLEGPAQLIGDSELVEKIRYSMGTIKQWDPDSAVTLELSIQANLLALQDAIEGLELPNSLSLEFRIREGLSVDPVFESAGR